MVFKAEIINEETSGPYYKIKFYYESEGIVVKSGYAEILKHSPKPLIYFDKKAEDTASVLTESYKAEMELISIVLRHLFVKNDF